MEPGPQTYEFGDFHIDANQRLLLRNGEPVALTPKVFDTLLHLVQHQGEVAAKDELIRDVWPDTVVEENNLNQNISTLRRILGENRYILTVPGKGHRFVAHVRVPGGGRAAPLDQNSGRAAVQAAAGRAPRRDSRVRYSRDLNNKIQQQPGDQGASLIAGAPI